MIFTADDFGISQKADERILKLAEAGVLDRVAVMTRGTATASSLERLAKSGVKIDLHAEIRDDIDPNRTLRAGAIGRILIFVKNFLFGENRVSRVAERWDAQIRDFQSTFGRYPDGLNSHEHTHFFRRIFEPFFSLQGSTISPLFDSEGNRFREMRRYRIFSTCSAWRTDGNFLGRDLLHPI